MGPLAIAGLSAGAGLLGSAFNINQQNKQNNKSQRFSWEMYAQQRRDAMSDWNMHNAYNDPSAQMQRLKNAGLNPNLVYGNGADAQAGSAPRSADAPSPTFNAPKVNLDTNSIALMALQAEQLKANISRTEAETERIQADTQSMLYDNQHLTPEMFMLENQTRRDKALFGSQNIRNEAQITQLKKETANLMAGYTSHNDFAKNPDSKRLNPNLAVSDLLARIQQTAATTKGTELANELKRYETELIQSLGVSGSHAGTIVSNILKLILLSKN